MPIVKSKNKKTGVTYVYESESYWDKEKQQSRAHRRLIGKLDEKTGDIIPTGKSGRRDENGEIKYLYDKQGNPIYEPIPGYCLAVDEKKAAMLKEVAEKKSNFI